MKDTHLHLWRYVFGFIIASIIIVGTFYFANELQQNDQAREWVQSFGYLGVLAVAIVGGLNVLVPIPASVFTPIFTEAGFGFPAIISLLVIGTVIADLIGYTLGYFGRTVTSHKPPDIVIKIEDLIAKNPKLVIPVMTLWAAFAPLPNEILLIPLGLAGYRLTYLIPSLIVGNIIHQSIFVFGIDGMFNWIF
jgi:membrane protein DedA with SNARE-associated domain